MNFVRKQEDQEPDAWLADMDEAAMEQSIGEAAKALKVTIILHHIYIKFNVSPLIV